MRKSLISLSLALAAAAAVPVVANEDEVLRDLEAKERDLETKQIELERTQLELEVKQHSLRDAVEDIERMRLEMRELFRERERQVDGMNMPRAYRQLLDRPANVMAAFIGLGTAPASSELRAEAGLDDGFGLVIERVVEESPAADAEVKRGDLLIMLDDQRIANAPQFAALVRSYDAGDVVTLLLFRDGEEVEVDVKLAAAMVPPLEMYGETLRSSVPWPDLRERRQMVPQLRAIELPPAPPVIDRIPDLFPGDDRDGFKGNISRSVIRDDRGSAT
ncbi:MAG: PDZ domain-containing protein, partial [Planctomycetota bacterium]